MRRVLTLIIIVLLMATIAPMMAEEKYVPPHDQPGPAVDRLIFKKVDQDLAPKLIERGDIDIYLYNLKISTAYEYLKSRKVRIYEAPSSMISILMNPAPAPKGSLNPLSIKRIRWAIQFLIDRDSIANSIYRGFALPMYSHVSPLDYDYLVVAGALKELGITYDPDYAKETIFEEMRKAGAELVNGKWIYEEKPVELKFIIRIEDERREIGNMLAEELEKLGFTVKRLYKDFAQALSIVYRTDPAAFEWHLYTEGWGRGAVERYDYATINQMCAPWLGYMPGWLEYGFWQYRNKRLDELGKRLFKGEYKDLAERNEFYVEATKLCLQESIRAWVVIVMNALPARADLKGVSTDAVSGLRSLWTLRSAYVEGGELKVGHLWVRPYMGSAWNPIAGFTDVYSVDIWRQLHDPPIWRDPSTGIPMPFRANYTVETAGPERWIDVPEDAFIWDSKSNSWVRVGEGVKARSKVVIDYSLYFKSRWHHGIGMDWSDVLYSIYQTFDMAYNPEKSKIEVALAATSKPILETFKGFRILDEYRLEVYVDYWHPIKDYIAEYAQPWGASMPWEILYAMDILVFEEKKAAYSDTAAARMQVDWLNLIEPKQARRLVGILRRLIEAGEYPRNIFEIPASKECFESVDDALKRYSASIKWFKGHGHLVISNGPFYLEKIGTVAEQYAELRAFRDPSYPFKPSALYVGRPKRIELDVPRIVNAIKGEPLKLDVHVEGPGKLGLKLILLDPYSGKIVYEAHAEKGLIEIPAEVFKDLREGIYKLSIIAYSDSISIVSERVVEISLSEKPPVKPTITRTITTTKTEELKPPERPSIITPTLIMVIVVVIIAVSIIALKFKKK
ncbi:MAG: hypothetical protein DRN60_00015 [Thaumarchaeota archaeon]|nr:MAG: hypothetical protein DRN60_00015 [Nitrososphaerota archaeon]